jgi:hypothetical protein
LAFYPSVHDPGSIEVLLDLVAEGRATKVVDVDYIVASGFKREQDKNLHGLLLFLGFIDDSGAPTDLWAAFGKDPDRGGLLGKLVTTGYQRVFKQLPVAERDGQALMAFFKNETGESDAVAAYMVLTFRVLCDLASFEEPFPEQAGAQSEDLSVAPVPEEEAAVPPSAEEEAPAAAPGGPVPVKLTLEIDIRSDPELRFMLKKLLQRQLGE